MLRLRRSSSGGIFLSEISSEYCKRTREVARELLKGISESLGLEEHYIDNALKLEKGTQVLVGNLYPPCPQPQLAMGLPPHSDHGLLILLIENANGGLQIQHRGKLVQVKSLPNSFLVNTGDHLEILSSGKYKNVVHRAIVNGKTTRISLAMTLAPSFGTVVSPAPELLNSESNPPAYSGMKYRDYLELQQSNNSTKGSAVARKRLPITIVRGVNHSPNNYKLNSATIPITRALEFSVSDSTPTHDSVQTCQIFLQ
ncbi:hypothetical protein NE237_017091 [Protea cynaroides]|uniref:Fe2OG dioxygenase domain-containing protein n=1 Tax=Protea cynaroides TaxID=273540 RepID=A0A9Q0K7D4_9MAGN|nr:hypothetical protein NE237_017091 [Protea cynaroides]